MYCISFIWYTLTYLLFCLQTTDHSSFPVRRRLTPWCPAVGGKACSRHVFTTVWVGVAVYGLPEIFIMYRSHTLRLHPAPSYVLCRSVRGLGHLINTSGAFALRCGVRQQLSSFNRGPEKTTFTWRHTKTTRTLCVFAVLLSSSKASIVESAQRFSI